MPIYWYVREKVLQSDGATVKDPAADHYVLYHERGFTEQIVWFVKSTNTLIHFTMVDSLNRSGCGSYVLTRSPRGIKIFTKVRCNLDFSPVSESVSGRCLPENIPSDT